VLLFSYRTSTNSADPGTTTAAATAPAPTGTAGATATPSPTTTPGSGGGTSSGSKTYTGSVAQTRWGPVQVTIAVSGSKITNVAVPTYPNGNRRDEEINASALPVLTQETLSAQSADIDTVSGATVTSDGYKESLQAALDAAHLA
jgi:uncharacterized protein with FMN-binding domain